MAQINMPGRREEKDPLDTILKGLSIAANVYGIKEAGEKSKYLAETKAREAETAKFNQAAKEAELTGQGFQKQADGSFLRPPGWKNPALEKEDIEAFSKGVIVERDKNTQAVLRMKRDPTFRNEATELRRLAVQDKMQKAAEEKVEKLSGKLQNAGELNSAINNIEKTLGFNLDDYADGTPLDLPGVSLPGIGRTSFYSGEARNLDKVIAKVFNVELKDRSGAAVTTPELERLKAEFGSGRFNTEEEMVGALRDYKSAFRDAVRNIEAGYPGQAAETIAGRGGFTGQAISKGTGQAAQFDRSGGLLAPQEANAAPRARGTPAPRQEMPQTVIQNGHTYRLNPKTGKYE